MKCDIYDAPMFKGTIEEKQEFIQACTSGNNLHTMLLGVVVLYVLLSISMVLAWLYYGR